MLFVLSQPQIHSRLNHVRAGGRILHACQIGGNFLVHDGVDFFRNLSYGTLTHAGFQIVQQSGLVFIGEVGADAGFPEVGGVGMFRIVAAQLAPPEK